MSGYTRREVDRAKRVIARFQEAENLEGHPRRDERFARMLATEFGSMRRGMILALRNEIDRQTAKLPKSAEPNSENVKDGSG